MNEKVSSEFFATIIQYENRDKALKRQSIETKVLVVATTLIFLWFLLPPSGTTVSATSQEQAIVQEEIDTAEFLITSTIKSPAPAFTLTIPAFGNTLKREGKGSFEHSVFRNSFLATQDSVDRIYNTKGIGIYDSYSSGYLDGAAARVFRIIGGKLQLVRKGKIASSTIEHWQHVNPGQLILPTLTSSQYIWESWGRKNASRYFSVVAIDKSGNISKPAKPIKLIRSEVKKNTKANNSFVKQTSSLGLPFPPPQPENFRAIVMENGIVEFSWDSVDVDDLAGYRIVYSDNDPAKHKDVYLEFEVTARTDQEKIQEGDLVFISKSLESFNSNWLSNRVGGLASTIRNHVPNGVPNEFFPNTSDNDRWRIANHAGGSVPEELGEHYLELTLSDSSVKSVGKSGIPDISHKAQNYYPVPIDGLEYKMEVWMKADSAESKPVVFTWSGDERIGGFVGKHEFYLTDKWRKYTTTFMGRSAEKGGNAYLVLNATGPGTFSFDNFRVFRNDTEFLGLAPYQYKQLEDSGMAALRTHGPIKTGRQTYSMHQFLNDAGLAEGIDKGNTLPQMLKVFKKAKVLPWLQIEFHMSDAEWLEFAEYMAAPYDPALDTPENKPIAYKRFLEGQQEPWINEFERIYFELGNETWNRYFAPWVFHDMPESTSLFGKKYSRGEVYAKMQDRTVNILRSSPYWSKEIDEKFQYVLGGWAVGNYSYDAAKTSETADFITIAGYNGGWDENEGPPRFNSASFFNVMMHVNQVAIPQARKFEKIAAELKSRGKNVRLGTYEAGSGYSLNGLNNAKVSKEQAFEQELVMKSKAAGTATIDAFLARAYYGFELQNFFLFGEGDLWKSHTHRRNGGQAHANFIPLQLFNKHGTGSILLTRTISVPKSDLPAYNKREAMINQPMAAVYATTQGDRVTLFCISRKIANFPITDDDGHLPFKVKLPFSKADSIKLYKMSGEYNDNNIYAENVVVEELDIAKSELSKNGVFGINEHTGGSSRGLPPAEVYVYVFKGTDFSPIL